MLPVIRSMLGDSDKAGSGCGSRECQKNSWFVMRRRRDELGFVK